MTATSNQQPATSKMIQLSDKKQETFLSEKRKQLKTLFPEIFCEEEIDWERFKLILGEDEFISQKERYQLNWAGKSEAYRVLQSPSFNTLSPDIDESVDFDNTKNLFIEAENLEALKILQKSYAGKVKMIYIDPPYNTGQDSFIYPDKFTESKKEYAKRIGDTDENDYLIRDGLFEGAWRKNSKDNGHFHSNWLSMMLPRLHLAKTLLREDGVIFISIDDNEQAQLKLLCDEVFGEENFVGEIIWKKKNVVQNDAKFFSTDHEYLLCYTKLSDKLVLNRLSRTEEQEARYQNPDNDPRGAWTSVALQAKSGSKTYEITFPNGVFWKPVSGTFPRLSKESLIQAYNENRLWFGKDGKNVPRLKKYLSEVKDGVLSNTVWLNELVGSTQIAKELVKRILNSNVFDTPKPVQYLSRMLQLTTDKNSLILDFFAGSGTTAHAVMQLNAEDNGNRRFICIQLPEKTDKQSEAAKAGFATIADIAKARIRRAGSDISGSLKEGQTVDTGFKVFKLSESHFKQWQNPLSGSLNAEQQLLLLEDFQDVVKENVSQKDLAYELMLRLGFELTDEIEFQDSIVWLNNAEQTRKTALLLDKVNQDVLDQVLEKSPKKVFALDKVFGGNDSLKTNMAFQLQNANIDFETL